MKNLSAQQALENSGLKKIDHLEIADVVRPAGEFHLLYLDHKFPLQQKGNLLLKRGFDLLISFLLLAGLSIWLFPIIALLIKLDSKGPVFFFQKRNKKNGKLFTCIKFRTMIVNDKADELPATENDRRITRIGKILRCHHLDELPQLLNVFMGDMSMIGPRPYMISDNKKYEVLIKDYSIRFKVKPGITGLAQVFDQVNPVVQAENMEARAKKDIYYVYNWSPVLDAKIFFRTFFKMAAMQKQS